MKKLLALVLGLVVAFSTMMFTACGSTIFDGNYSEATKEEVTAFAATIADDEFDFGKGLELSLDMEQTMGDQTMTSKITGKFATVNEVVQMSSEVDMVMTMTEGSMSVKGAAYHKDGWAYVNVKADLGEGEQEQKIKEEVPAQMFINNFGFSQLETDISMLLEQLAMYETMTATAENPFGFKLYMDKGESETKIKIEIPEQSMTIDASQLYPGGEIINISIKAEYVLVFDAENKLIAARTVMENTTTQDGDTMYIKADISAKPFEGTIELPADVDTYVEDSIDF